MLYREQGFRTTALQGRKFIRRPRMAKQKVPRAWPESIRFFGNYIINLRGEESSKKICISSSPSTPEQVRTGPEAIVQTVPWTCQPKSWSWWHQCPILHPTVHSLRSALAPYLYQPSLERSPLQMQLDLNWEQQGWDKVSLHQLMGWGTIPSSTKFRNHRVAKTCL